jgi:hypothetical protein
MPDINDNRRNETPLAKVRFVVGQIILFVFGIPFVAVGIFMLSHARKEDNAALLAISSLIFCAFGLWTMFKAATAGRRKRKAEAKLLKQTVGGEKPWLARADWADGKIKSTSTVPVWFFLLWSFVALALSAPGVWQIPKELKNGNDAILIVLIFPLVAFGLLGYTFKLWCSHRRFGDCFFEPAQTPIPIGGVLEGMIQTGKPLKLEHELNLKFSCIRRVVSGSGKNRQVNEYTLWQTEKTYSEQAGLSQMEAGQTGIPVHFKLPADQPECFSRANESVFWRLDAKSKMRGPDFRAVFDLPVFKVAGADVTEADEAEDSDPTAALQAPIEEIRREENSRIKVFEGPDGREFYFPPARNVGAAIFVTLATFLFIGIAAGTYHLHAPILFPIIFGIIGGLMILGVLSAWLKSSRVTIDSTNVRVSNCWLVFSRTRQFSTSDVSRFVTKIGMQSGSQMFTDIKLIPRGSDEKYAADEEKFQKTFQDADVPGVEKVVSRFREATSLSGVTVASSIASVAEANWLVAEMNKALGRKS